MSHSAQAANQIKQEAGFTTLPLPSCFDAGRCGRNGHTVDIYTCVYGNGGTMANAGKMLILAVFNYDDYIIQVFSSVAI